MTRLYDAPFYYDAAFSYRDVDREVAVIRECIARYSKPPVKSVLELACGQAPYATALMNCGYRYGGLDASTAMLDYAKQRLGSRADEAVLRQADMIDFEWPDPVDFAFVLLASLYAQSNEDLLSHYNAVARALRPGGLYLLEWCVEFDPLSDVAESWDVDRDGVHVTAMYFTQWRDRIKQIIQETIRLDITEADRTFTIEDTFTRRVCFPQEYLLFIRERTPFEFVGWWNDWDLDESLDDPRPVSRPIILLRRR